MIKKGRTNKLRHVPRTHRIDLDWLFYILREDPGLKIKYISTKDQVADIFTKGLFTAQFWSHLTLLSGISHSRHDIRGDTNNNSHILISHDANMNGKSKGISADSNDVLSTACVTTTLRSGDTP